jgi:AraC-like DNA-binding protein
MAATGATWQEIADQLGYRSRQAASHAVKRLGNRTPPETVEQARAKHDNALHWCMVGGTPRGVGSC